ncbi:cytidine deaminase [Caldicellulosiruptor obsidiansis OB47]|uniref:Cytidine deaminase n=1 Tax=Caldicellulosiruptor obsidiansis (strain ATCC BAA-2073 / JCM 16842 / OB47) TaxID=608506 RepID=D9TFA3_CALOO|nr:cytidine deaminase [Caldicellulosiruptor obsidiansis]ADL42873.1 cytidine deaminase [Caldicellulosiruptor obsidiansis OB47]
MKYLDNVDDTIIYFLTLAKEAQKKAYAPYSCFKVGAAAVGNSSKVYTGCNVENASYPLSMCAERIAIFKAISEGESEIKALYIIGPENEPISPCGACRQVIFELARNSTIYLSNCDMTKVIETNSKELLPYGFDLKER